MERELEGLPPRRSALARSTRPYEGAPLVLEDGQVCRAGGACGPRLANATDPPTAAQTRETTPCPVATAGWQAFSQHCVVSYCVHRLLMSPSLCAGGCVPPPYRSLTRLSGVACGSFHPLRAYLFLRVP